MVLKPFKWLFCGILGGLFPGVTSQVCSGKQVDTLLFHLHPSGYCPGLWLCSRLCLMWNCLRLVCPWSWLCTTQPDLFLYQFHLLSIESSTSSNVCKLTTCCRIQIPDFYFLNKGALIIGIADKRPLIQRVMFWPYLLSW